PRRWSWGRIETRSARPSCQPVPQVSPGGGAGGGLKPGATADQKIDLHVSPGGGAGGGLKQVGEAAERYRKESFPRRWSWGRIETSWYGPNGETPEVSPGGGAG